MIYTTYHASGNEDARLRERWPACPDKGVFVDVGAGDPKELSNTYHFERNGWTGLLIEPGPARIAALRAGRTQPVLCAAVGMFDEPVVPFYLDSNPDLSSTIPRGNAPISVAAMTLESAVNRYAIMQIDLLSIDVEGLELSVCRSLSWGVHRPRAVIIEHEHCDAALLLSFFVLRRYQLMEANGSNFIFLAPGEPLLP